MNQSLNSERKYWFAMRATYCREEKAKLILEENGIDCFIPMHYKLDKRKRRKELTPIIRCLLFAHSTPTAIQAIKEGLPYLQYITNKRKKCKIIIPDTEMEQFIRINSSYDEGLLYQNPEDINFDKGTKVRITGGVFDGIEGVFVRIKGKRDRKVVVSIDNIIAVAMVTIPAEYIEVIKE